MSDYLMSPVIESLQIEPYIYHRISKPEKLIIVILTDNFSTYPDYNHWDGPLAAGYLMLAARALGYGTVFITDAISGKVTTDVLGIPDKYTRVCITPLGIPVEWPATPQKKDLKEFFFFDKL